MKKLLLPLLLMVIFSSAAAKVVDYIVAVVNDEPILYSELIEYAKISKIPDLRAARDSLIEKKILLTVAKSKGIDASDEEISQSLENFLRINGFKSVEELKMEIEKEGLTLDEVKKKLKEQIIISKLIAKDVKSKITVTDVDVQKACEEAMSKPKREVYYIFVKKGNEEKLQKVMDAINSGVPFEEAAKKYSDDTVTGEKGGYLGDVTKGSLIKPLDLAVWSTKPGSIKKVESKDGYYIVYVKREFIEGCDKNKIKEKLYMERFRKALKDYIDNLKRSASVKVYL
jgi:parvulin-like peptidyl-prolyl isomerase